jgi:hypothetical protein
LFRAGHGAWPYRPIRNVEEAFAFLRLHGI